MDIDTGRLTVPSSDRRYRYLGPIRTLRPGEDGDFRDDCFGPSPITDRAEINVPGIQFRVDSASLRELLS
jgi:hypothetical protein